MTNQSIQKILPKSDGQQWFELSFMHMSLKQFLLDRTQKAVKGRRSELNKQMKLEQKGGKVFLKIPN